MPAEGAHDQALASAVGLDAARYHMSSGVTSVVASWLNGWRTCERSRPIAERWATSMVTGIPVGPSSARCARNRASHQF